MDERDFDDMETEDTRVFDGRGRVTCGRCGGTGLFNRKDCPVCEGNGYE
jgi:DnaJ-class molecular chaperone